MKVTQIRFSYAVSKELAKERNNNRLAVFSIEMDGQLLIYKVYLTARKTSSGYFIVLPQSKTPTITGEVEKPRVYFTDKGLFQDVLDIVIEMYEALMREYDGKYEMSTNGRHLGITVESARTSLKLKELLEQE